MTEEPYASLLASQWQFAIFAIWKERMIKIREIKECDAKDFLDLCKRLDDETQFMLLELGERRTTVEEQREHINTVLVSDNQTILVVERDSQLAGYLAAFGGEYKRNRHSAYIVVGILQAFSGQGIGTRLFTAVDQWAREHAIHRLELTVMTHNEVAVHLYKNMGFQIEGIKKDSLLVEGTYVDEYYMAKLLT